MSRSRGRPGGGGCGPVTLGPGSQGNRCLHRGQRRTEGPRAGGTGETPLGSLEAGGVRGPEPRPGSIAVSEPPRRRDRPSGPSTHSRPLSAWQSGLTGVTLEGKEQNQHDDPDDRRPTPSPRARDGQAHLLSWRSLRPLGSLHSGKPDDPL